MAVARISHATSAWGTSRCLAWVVMPDHWHRLVELGDETLGKAIARFKAGVSRELGVPALWQPGFHDRCLRREEDLRRSAAYIVLNPVRAGLAIHVMDYPYWNAVWL